MARQGIAPPLSASAHAKMRHIVKLKEGAWCKWQEM
jgi:hypothetical protein